MTPDDTSGGCRRLGRWSSAILRPAASWEEAAMGLINWIFDFYQQYRIDQLRDEAARPRVPFP